MKSRYAIRKAAGICVDCNQPAENSRPRCPKCNERVKAIFERRRISGSCANCNRPRDTLFKLCSSCRSKKREASKRRYLKNESVREYGRIRALKRYYSDPRVRKGTIKRAAYRLKTDIQFKLGHILRGRLRQAIKKGWKIGSAVSDLGCSISEFKLHLEKQFHPGMTWENYGKGFGKWNIDHIVPLASVDLANREQFLKVCHYTNLQPLWEIDNIRKGCKLPEGLTAKNRYCE